LEDVSIVEVYVNACGLYFMLEGFLEKSRQKYHNVVVGKGGNEVHIAYHNVDSVMEDYELTNPLSIRSTFATIETIFKLKSS